jgi:hypothetical protein
MKASAKVRYEREKPRLLLLARSWRENNKARRRDIARSSKYGMSAGQFDRMLAEQNYRCAICDQDRKLGVDHCHVSNKIRGLLCIPCNAALGSFGENASVIRRAAEYVESAK